jgi:hypothetical protein
MQWRIRRGTIMMDAIQLRVNGELRSVDVEGRTLLVELLRDKLGLTGTHVGCDTSSRIRYFGIIARVAIQSS